MHNVPPTRDEVENTLTNHLQFLIKTDNRFELHDCNKETIDNLCMKYSNHLKTKFNVHVDFVHDHSCDQNQRNIRIFNCPKEGLVRIKLETFNV